ncbi:transcriptional regulator [Clostridium zeae]|uniref:Transcriptional regulator n=1 Tax=Clostridium zeae TaxID=2759022 RepID=A0ABQ1E7A0_9CLOT|nr:PLP-dependent aminotransferase family protein [Clostridium zeae]GFZ30634.1 transcriptional regulator [Clostridium zeae]
MDKYRLKFNDELNKYIQLYAHIKSLIDKNQIEDGEKLPSIRELADFLKLNKVTIINAYKKLQAEGYANQKIGSGTYAKRRDSIKGFKKSYSITFKKLSSGRLSDVIDFTGETTSADFFPVADLKAVLNDVLDRDGAEALIYQDVLGYEKLRERINEKFWDNKLDFDDILIVSGAQQGIDIVSKALINVNDNIIVEKPTYSGALSVFKSRKANIFEVPIEKDGVDLEALKKILKKNKIKCFYFMSYFQNPSTVSYSDYKKEELLKLAEEHDFYIIEDDYLSELIYDESTKYSSMKSYDKNDRVIYIKSFSKIFLPGIRIGYLVCPRIFKDSVQNSKVNTDISTSSLMQRALEMYMEREYWVEHIKLLNVQYKERYDFMKTEIQNKLNERVEFDPPGGGLHFYLKLSESIQINSIELFYKLREKGILITPGVMFYKHSKEGERYFKIGFSQTDCDKIKKGIDIISSALSEEAKVYGVPND